MSAKKREQTPRNRERTSTKAEKSLEVVFVCWKHRRAVRVNLRAWEQSPLSQAVREYLYSRAFLPGTADLALFDITQGRRLDPECSPVAADVRDGDVLLLHPPGILPRGAESLENGLAFEPALARVRAFHQGSHLPEVVRCHVTEEEFGQLLEAAVVGLPADLRFGGPHLVADLIRTLDLNMTQRSGPPGFSLLEHTFLILRQELRGEDGHRFISQLEDTIHAGQRPELGEVRQVRFVANTAALHLEPSPSLEDRLTTQFARGLVEIEQVRVNTTEEAVAPPRVLGDDDTPPPARRGDSQHFLEP